ncbi:hypothetical protein [Haloarcula pellucida]|uniref:hypothetical protein n=1 Tax=Haloarcula pellucida TaxID=1427151 RepID=UPI00166DD30C|nr:hypothetical protein [Halomicroarcula pellucida]MBX0348725.1 hypothetical protein [Halomicroarcula pellucida]
MNLSVVSTHRVGPDSRATLSTPVPIDEQNWGSELVDGNPATRPKETPSGSVTYRARRR